MTTLRLPHQQLHHIAQNHPSKIFMRQPRDGQWHSYTYAEIERQVVVMASALLDLGLQSGDKVAIFAKNSMEWVVADLAIAQAGCVSVPIFAAADRPYIEHVMRHSEAKVVFVGKLDKYEQYEGVFADDCISIGFPYPTITTDKQWSVLLESTKAREAFPQREMQDMMTIIYTSGSTGTPKGVVHSFQGIAEGSINYTKCIHDAHDLHFESYLSYLPLAHITERVVGEGVWLYCFEVGALIEVSFTESLETFVSNLQDTQPTLFVSVPRLWQKFQSGVLAKMPQSRLDILLRIPFVAGLVKKKIRKNLGFSRTKLFGCGSAPITPSLLAWYESVGINLSQAWGMTETSAAGTIQTPYRSEKRETIGYPIQGVELRIGDEQEIQVKGPCIFKEYYKQPELNAEVFTEDGFFRTGDQGEQDSEGYVRIIGRLKDIFKTDKGKYVAPAPIEAVLGKAVVLDQLCVVGTNLPQPLVLAVLDENALANNSREQVASELETLLNEVNNTLEKHERLSGILILNEPWTVENGLVTPTLKVKRQVVEKRFFDLYQQPLASKVNWQ